MFTPEITNCALRGEIPTHMGMEVRAREIKKQAPAVTVVPNFQAKEALAKLFP